MRVLIAALNWGLGHTTRMLPIIYRQIKSGNEVVVAGSIRQCKIYTETFPNVRAIELKGSEPRYSRTNQQIMALLTYTIAFGTEMISDKRWLNKLLKKEYFDLIISDNRFGLHHKGVESIIITHQLSIKVPQKINFLQTVINLLNHFFLNKFDACWVPDDEFHSLSGELSITKNVRLPIQYIGPQSRFTLPHKEPALKPVETLFIISGPEHQRTVFENIILAEIKNTPLIGSYLIVRGLPQVEECSISNAVNHLPADSMYFYIKNAKHIICRAGYSSIMDLEVLNKKAVLVPTPGQTEQKYLAHHMHNKGRFYCMNQSEFNLQEAINCFTSSSQ